MVTIKTINDIELDVNKSALDDVLLMVSVSKLDSEPWQFDTVLEKLIGSDQKAKLYSSLMTEDGRIPVTTLTDVIKDIFEGLGKAGKNFSLSRPCWEQTRMR